MNSARLHKMVAFVLCLLFALAAPAHAQDETPLDPAAAPSSGSVTITSAFSPDPMRARIIGGGDVNSVTRGLGDDCVGYIALTPDYAIDAASSFRLLRLIFISDALTVDTTLIVRDPAGRFFCNNNVSGLFNPMVSIADALPGRYAVWVGGFTPGVNVFGDLYTTTNAGAAPGTTGIVLPLATSMPTMPPPGVFTPTPPPGTAFDVALPAVHGDVALTAGFLPDPFWRVVVAGGGVPAPVNAGCVGYANAAPDVRLRWSGSSTRLRMMLIVPDGVEAGGSLDLALAVRDPAGVWHCAEDWAGGYTAPLLEIANPLSGDYAIWATVENGIGAAVTGIFYTTEITDTIETIDHAESIPAQPLAVSEAVASAEQIAAYHAEADPLRLLGIAFAGGEIDVGAGYPTPAPYTRAARCVGIVPIAPSATILLDTPQPALRVFFQADSATGSIADPVLIVQMPDGRWYCGDDAAGGSKDPQIDIVGNLSTGAAQVWVGGFSSAERFTGTLTVTRADNASATPLLPDRAPGALPIDAAPLANIQPFPLLDAAQYIAVTPDALTALIPTAESASGGLEAQGAGQSGQGTASDAGASALGLDIAGVPNYGELMLAPGFGAPLGAQTVSGIGGGEIDLAAFGVGANGEACEGYVSAAPDVRVQWAGSAPGGLLRAYFMAEGDTTLVVRAPDGRWYCGDDQAGTLSPQVDLLDAVSGAYTIWIGSYEAGGYLPGVLTLTDDSARTLLTE